MSYMYTRLQSRLSEIEQSFFLFGPRGTGKTTWLKSHFAGSDNVYIDLLRGDLYTELLAQPSRLETLIPEGFSGWVILVNGTDVKKYKQDSSELRFHQGYTYPWEKIEMNITTYQTGLKMSDSGVAVIQGSLREGD